MAGVAVGATKEIGRAKGMREPARMAIEAMEAAGTATEAGLMVEEPEKAPEIAVETAGVVLGASEAEGGAEEGAKNERRRAGGAKGPTRVGDRKKEAAAENGGTEVAGGKSEVENNEGETSEEDSTAVEATSG